MKIFLRKLNGEIFPPCQARGFPLQKSLIAVQALVWGKETMKTPLLTQPTNALAAELLELFYPIHYTGGMALEDAMRGKLLTRTQVAILWIIRSEGKQGKRMARKVIERLLATWFEVTSSSITKALRTMARPPLNLVQIMEDPYSGREKQIQLTAKGERFLVTMLQQGQTFLQAIVEQLSEEDVRGGIHFLRQAVAIFERHRAEQVARDNKRPSHQGPETGSRP